MRAAIALPFVSLLGSPIAAQQPERFALAGREVAVYNLAGTITVEPGRGPVAVLVARGGPDASRLRVERGELRGREVLRVRYPADRVVYEGYDRGSSTTLPVRDDGTFGDGDGRRVRISGGGEGLRAHADLRVQVPAGVEVALHLAVGIVSIANVEGRLHVDAHSAPVSATGTKGELRVDVGSGTVNVSGAEGVLMVDTGSGSVEVSRFRGTELSVDTGSGDVTASDIEAGEIEIETGSGSVTADLRSPLSTLRVETGSGNISVTAPGSLGAMVELETASGDIETDFALQVTRHSRDHIVGQIGNGKGRIAIESGSGDVRLLRRS